LVGNGLQVAITKTNNNILILILYFYQT